MRLALPGFTRRRFQEVVCFMGMVPGYGAGFAWLLKCLPMVLRRIRLVGFAWLSECVLAVMRRGRLATARGVQCHPKCIQYNSDFLDSKNTLYCFSYASKFRTQTQQQFLIPTFCVVL